MLLKELTQNEKDLFISLSVYAAKLNGILEDEEKGMIENIEKNGN